MKLKKLLAVMAAAMLVGSVRGEVSPGSSVEQQLAEAAQSSKVTVIHFWAPWCPNCKAELANGAWSGFINANPDVNFVFVTLWNGADGHELLAKNGVGAEKNFRLLLHPNPSRKREDKVSELLGLPLSWIPTTWVFREGKLRYALNYGELRFPMLRQLILDSSDPWEH